jgi:hypothetical protein
MELQHLNVKLFVLDPAAVDLEPFVGVFNRWIQAQDLRFETRALQLIVNDRLLVPNTPAAESELRPELSTFLHELFGGAAFSLSRSSGNPRERFTLNVRTEAELSLEALIENVARPRLPA